MASKKRKEVVLSTEQKLETLKKLDKAESMQKKCIGTRCAASYSR
jgi:hypothetical protein